VHLVGFIMRIYHDTRSSECQNRQNIVPNNDGKKKYFSKIISEILTTTISRNQLLLVLKIMCSMVEETYGIMWLLDSVWQLSKEKCR
jgi:hypothetical protein